MSQVKNKSILTGFSLVLLLLGIACLIVKGFTPEHIDAQGILHEPYFFLLPIGFGNILLGLILGTIGFIKKMFAIKK